MFDFGQLERSDGLTVLGVAVGIGIGAFVTAGADGLTGRLTAGVASAAVAAVTAVLFLALE